MAPIGTNVRFEEDQQGIQRIAYAEEGWDTWKWNNIDVNYIAYGNSGPAVVLLHGFGASVYQWRYNIPELAKSYRVFALDLVGFGKSEKVVMDYSGGHVWSTQVSEFIEEFIGVDGAYIVGNSLGGFAALTIAARKPELVKGVVGLNIAGTFSEDIELMPTESKDNVTMLQKWTQAVGTLFRRLVVLFTFYSTRSRIREILMNVYKDKTNVDDDLVRSIEAPAEDPVASEVYYRLIQSTLSKSVTIDSLLETIDVPLLLLWGMKDPWMTPRKAEKILKAYPKAEMIPLDAGHCPQDEIPTLVNQSLGEWIQKVH
eukprot:g8235.t1